MPLIAFFATNDPALAREWERQLPPGRTAFLISEESSPAALALGTAAVVVLDLAAERLIRPALAKLPTILVGEPRSTPFEQARMAGRAKFYLSYEDSARRLAEVLPVVEELAEKQSLLELLAEKRRHEQAVPPVRPPEAAADPAELWDFVEGVVEHLDSRDRLLAEFRRATRTLLHASHAVFFLREAAGFRADRGTSFLPADDPIVPFFEGHPAVVDGNHWESGSDPVAELAVRNYLALWGARLLVPIHDNGRLLGLIACGVRDDGRPFSEADRNRAVFLARLLRHSLAKAGTWVRLHRVAEHANLGVKYLPRTLVLTADENPPRHVPVVVRDLIGQARRSRQLCRIAPKADQPFRASAGLIAETGGVWAAWEEASAEVRDAAERERCDRQDLLRELGLTLAHELGNGLVSLATLRQLPGTTPPPGLWETAKADIAKLEQLNSQVGLLQRLPDSRAAEVDLRDMAASLGTALNLRVETGTEPVRLRVAADLMEFALRAIIAVVAENRQTGGTEDLILQLRATGEGDERTALLSLQGKALELEGILPQPSGADQVPNQGRIAIFLAKEILRWHQGEIHGGPGLTGTEILFSVRSLRGAGAPG